MSLNTDEITLKIVGTDVEDPDLNMRLAKSLATAGLINENRFVISIGVGFVYINPIAEDFDSEIMASTFDTLEIEGGGTLIYQSGE